jgi:hypothetical protein
MSLSYLQDQELQDDPELFLVPEILKWCNFPPYTNTFPTGYMDIHAGLHEY